MISIKKWLWETCPSWSQTGKQSGRLKTQIEAGFSTSQIHFIFLKNIFFLFN